MPRPRDGSTVRRLPPFSLLSTVREPRVEASPLTKTVPAPHVLQAVPPWAFRWSSRVDVGSSAAYSTATAPPPPDMLPLQVALPPLASIVPPPERAPVRSHTEPPPPPRHCVSPLARIVPSTCARSAA